MYMNINMFITIYPTHSQYLYSPLLMFRCCLQNWCRDLGLFAVPPPQRSAVAVVCDPLERFIAGYGEIEQSTSQVDDSLYSFFPEKNTSGKKEGVKKKLVKFKVLLYHPCFF